jgi:CBS domain-containing protein
LIMELAITNRGDEPFSFTAALHTYLRVDDIAATQIENVKDLKYFDAVLKQEAVQSEDALTFPGEIDRVYFDPKRMIVRDGKRSLEVQLGGFSDGVIWNPGAKLAARLVDLEPGGYQRFVCVEAAVFRAPITLQPYQTWRGGQTLTAEPSDETRGDSLWGAARVGDVLAAKRRHLIVAAAPTDRVLTIIERLKIHDISQMPVLADDKLLGLITESTLLAHLAVSGHTVEDAIAPMINQQVVIVAPEMPAGSLLNLFGEAQAVIVVEDDRVLGILTKLDVIDFLTARLK